MGVTFNTSSGMLGSHGANGLYGRISAVNGPNKSDARTSPTVAAYWYVTYEVSVHKDQSTRNSDPDGQNRTPMLGVDRFKWTAANLDTYPTMAFLYADLKTKLGSISHISSIADAD